MEITNPFSDLLVMKPKIFEDSRGYFYESFKQNELDQHTAYSVKFVQENQSYSTYGVFRGFHLQTGNFAQAKLVRVLKGTVVDIVIDVREHSKTFGKTFQIELSDANHLQFFVPRGFAHGFVVTSDDAIFHYKCDNYYDKEHESGLNPFDKELEINWPVDKDVMKILDKDLKWPGLEFYK